MPICVLPSYFHSFMPFNISLLLLNVWAFFFLFYCNISSVGFVFHGYFQFVQLRFALPYIFPHILPYLFFCKLFYFSYLWRNTNRFRQSEIMYSKHPHICKDLFGINRLNELIKSPPPPLTEASVLYFVNKPLILK